MFRRIPSQSLKYFRYTTANRFYSSGTDSTMGKQAKLDFIHEEMRKAQNMLAEMRDEAQEHRKVYHESKQHLQSAIEQSTNQVREALESHSSSTEQTVDSLKKEIAELRELVKQMAKK
mmetsp:Transcript_1836/g.6512  ORF Transcript_1836/g.6512 Transcript_1836/m.6512 type:complete len:118 (-) Transcript_1836:179-532(-)